MPHREADRDRAAPLLEIGWLLVAVLVPLAVNLWASQPFEPTKAAVLRSLVWAMAGLWLVDNLLRRRSLVPELRGNPVLWPVLALVSVLTLATLTAVDWRLSLWGSYERGQGLLTLLCYPLLFLIVSTRLRTHRQARRLTLVMAATAAPLVVIGLAQALGWRPANLMTDARSPVFATLGRSNFLGSYLAMLLPLAVALALTAGQRWQRFAGAGLVAGILLTLALTLSRGAWLAAATAVFLLGLLWLWPRLARGWRIAAGAGGATALVGTLAAVLWLGREGGSTAARLAIWRATLDLIAQRPWLGSGPDGLGLVFANVYPPQLVYYQGRGIAVDRAHNLILDWGAMAGLLGVVAALLLLATFFVAGWKAAQRIPDEKQRLLLLACLAAVAGNVAGNLVSFDLTATATATWLLMAVTVGPPRSASVAVQAPSSTRSREGVLGRPAARWALTGLALAIVGAAIYQANVRPVAADVIAQVADQRSRVDDWPGALEARERAAALWPHEPAHRLALAWSYLQQGLSARDPLPWLQLAESELLRARDLRPADHQTWVALGELYGTWGNRWDGSKLALAHSAYSRAAELAPHHAMVYTAWGLVDKEGGRFAEAAARFRQAVDLDSTDGFAFSHLGDAELAQGHVYEALDAYRQAAHWEPELSYAHAGLARCYAELGMRTASRHALEEALRLDPGNPVALALREQME
jgi:O-antigen ligase/Tfp pilus assembly protein PilF